MHLNWFPLTLLWWTFLNVQSSLLDCPTMEDIHPCLCVSDGRDIRIDCIQIRSVNELRLPLKGLTGIKKINIDFLRCNLIEVPTDLFNGLDIMQLSFTNCDIHGSNRISLSGLERSLKELSVTFSFTGENVLSVLDTSNLHALEHLQVEGNNIPKLGNNWFQDGPPNLQNLFILTNFIGELGDKAFSSLKSIRNLWLTGNTFSKLRRSMFSQPASRLVSLDISDNKIENLPEDIFFGMPALKEVVLSENYLKDLPENIWLPVWMQLTRLYIEDNPLVCGNNLYWMTKHEKKPYVIKGKCAEPPEMKGKELRSLSEKRHEEFRGIQYEKSPTYCS